MKFCLRVARSKGCLLEKSLCADRIQWESVSYLSLCSSHNSTQECIPVGCVPSATVAVCWPGGGSPPHTHPGAGTPPPGAGTHPGDLLQGMLGYHLQGMLGYHPRRPAARHAGIPPARHAGIPPPLWTHTHLRNFVADGNKLFFISLYTDIGVEQCKYTIKVVAILFVGPPPSPPNPPPQKKT